MDRKALRADLSVVEISVGAKFSSPVQAGPGAVQLVLDIFPGDKVAEAWHCPSTPHLAPRLKNE
jgi:hypothetical protein